MNRLSAMETFIRVIDAGSFSDGAKQLRVGPPRPSQFEDHLGMRLLLRSTHGPMPAAAGRSFYEHAKRSIGEADEAELAAQQLSRPPPAAPDARHAAMFGSVEMSTQKTVRILGILPVFSL